MLVATYALDARPGKGWLCISSSVVSELDSTFHRGRLHLVSASLFFIVHVRMGAGHRLVLCFQFNGMMLERKKALRGKSQRTSYSKVTLVDQTTIGVAIGEFLKWRGFRACGFIDADDLDFRPRMSTVSEHQKGASLTLTRLGLIGNKRRFHHGRPTVRSKRESRHNTEKSDSLYRIDRIKRSDQLLENARKRNIWKSSSCLTLCAEYILMNVRRQS